ncbi:hypothetical protein A8E95_16305 [Burkholderia cenocepacia]|nr:hypothetical protein A8E95_16305 [Burkholderia cenocepacia]
MGLRHQPVVLVDGDEPLGQRRVEFLLRCGETLRGAGRRVELSDEPLDRLAFAIGRSRSCGRGLCLLLGLGGQRRRLSRCALCRSSLFARGL